MSKYLATIGMEIHVELKTKSKMFCSCKNDMELDKDPNSNICEVCTAQPGTLPVPNSQAIRFVQLAGLALNCNLLKDTKFDRKNYFYPDIPKGYQISQYDQPFCEKGELEIKGKKVGVTRIHLEEDTGKLTHPKGTNYSLVDFNRAGVPLMELVTEPDFTSGEEAREFCQKLQQVCRYLEISDADMEKGHMRCEANISVHKEDEDKLSGTKVEVKNINSFRFVQKAIEYEIARQVEALENGEKIIQETRGWDSIKNITVSQRVKETAADYRYFPEPDIPPMLFDDAYIETLKGELPELPKDKLERFIKEYGVGEREAELLVSERDLANYFEKTVSELEEKISAGEIKATREKLFKLTVNYLNTEIRKHLVDLQEKISDIKITPENYAELIGIVAEGKINSSAAQIVLEEMYKNGGDPSQIIEEKNLAQMDDAGEMEKIVDKILADNQASVTDYKNGKENAFKFLMGQVMKETKGKANPQSVTEILKNKLSQ
ncbi:MAG: Aspartyl/glutamyl-tRNA(Asn/Gln) amidotransferase subunit B [Candidatus Moranbacteria bacterium GW2011_GWE1_35_17]|nr:MAG: Aspartyl/glutamyl-tRNA(Asn/Gln) amidotransferase subunit B [Candidatus Moranbacteria bacterium GW2011_GWE1_35_17]KKP83954.1 MAG: Aspartyl/glutamyl-tRNA(Asn/Gln) amidotransferase subunit B [Candidatus Moranbacteria bacterium GW2011_GWF1_35_5]